MINKLKKWLKLYNRDEKHIIYTFNSSLDYCQTSIEFLQEHNRREFFGYDFDKGICFNFDNYLKSVLDDDVYNENYSFISELISDMYKSYSNYSGDRYYPIKSNNLELSDKKFYHQKDKYTPELCEIRLGLIKECKDYLKKLN